MEDMEDGITDHMVALEDVLLEHSVILECVDVKVVTKLGTDRASITEIPSMEGKTKQIYAIQFIIIK